MNIPDINPIDEIESGAVEQNDEAQAPELSVIEQKALSYGWKPKEEYKGDPDDWSDAEAYLLTTLDIKDKAVRNLKKANHSYNRVLQKTNEAAARERERYNEQIKLLEQDIEKAYNDGDSDTLHQKHVALNKAKEALQDLSLIHI